MNTPLTPDPYMVTSARRARGPRYGRLAVASLGVLAALLWIVSGLIWVAAAALRMLAFAIGLLADAADRADLAAAQRYGTSPRSGALFGLRMRTGGPS